LFVVAEILGNFDWATMIEIMNRNFFNRISTATVFCIMVCVRPAPAQQPTLEVLETTFEQQETLLTTLQDQKRRLGVRLDEKEKEIRLLKSDNDLGYLRRARLEKLLQESQDVAGKIEGIDEQQRRTQEALAATGRQLIARYQALLNETLAKLERKKHDTALRKTLTLKISQLRRKKEATLAKMGLRNPQDVIVGKVEIAPTDTPRQIREKGDLLKDQEEKLRALSKQLDKQSHEMQQELQLRNRIDDLVTDLSLFDQQEESISELQPDRVSSASEGSSDLGMVDGPAGSAFAVLDGLLVSQKDFDYTALSTDDLDQAIQQVLRRQKFAQSKADSLAERAKHFYQAAEDIYKQ